jgi:hypothetical protein
MSRTWKRTVLTINLADAASDGWIVCTPTPAITSTPRLIRLRSVNILGIPVASSTPLTTYYTLAIEGYSTANIISTTEGGQGWPIRLTGEVTNYEIMGIDYYELPASSYTSNRVMKAKLLEPSGDYLATFTTASFMIDYLD